MQEEKKSKPQTSSFSLLAAHNDLASVAVLALAAPAGPGTDRAMRWQRFRSNGGCWETCSGWYQPLGSSSSKSSFSLRHKPRSDPASHSLSLVLLRPLHGEATGARGALAAECRGWTWVMPLAVTCRRRAEPGARQMLSLWSCFGAVV